MGPEQLKTFFRQEQEVKFDLMQKVEPKNYHKLHRKAAQPASAVT